MVDEACHAATAICYNPRPNANPGIRMNDQIKQHVQNTSTWMRILFILLFWLVFNIVELVIGVLVLFQVVNLLVTGERNVRVLELSAQMNRYAWHILQFVTFNSDARPFPFSDWDSGGHNQVS